MHSAETANKNAHKGDTSAPSFLEFSAGRFVLLVAACAVLLVARSPWQVQSPQFVLEDGFVFFADAFNLPPLTAILKTYSGYWHLVPRLVAEAGSGAPLAVLPLFYTLTAVLINSVALSWFYLPHFRPVVASDGLRLGFVVLLVLLPGLDGPLLIAYVQWGLALWGVLLLLMEPPRSPFVQWLLAFVYIAAVATAPALFVLWPLWLWRLLQTHSRGQRAWMGAIVAATILIAFLTITGAVAQGSVAPSLAMGLRDTLYGLAFRVFATPLLGYPLAAQLLRTGGWLPLLFFAFAVDALLLAFLAMGPLRSGKERLRLAGTIVAVGAATAALYAWRAHLYGYPFVTAAGSVELSTIRYFFLAIVALFLLIFMALDWAIAARRLSLAEAGIAILILVLLYSPTFYLPYWPDVAWPRYARLLENRLDGQAVAWSADYPQPPDWPPAQAEAVALYVPVSPDVFKMRLVLPQEEAQGYPFPEGLRLLSLDSRQEGDQLEVTLQWLVTPAYSSTLPHTAYVHLLDAAGKRVAGGDTLLEAPGDGSVSGMVAQTSHALALPTTLAPGSYDAAIGLYTLADGQVLPGSAVILPGQLPVTAPCAAP